MDKVVRWLKQVEAFLDEWGKGAWIAAFVLGFILFWPIGLAILGYTLWSGRMGCWKNRRRQHRRQAAGNTGNSAFDEYREETLRRLEEEQTAFEGFLDRLRRSKDRAQFDQFMDERRRGGSESGPQAA